MISKPIEPELRSFEQILEGGYNLGVFANALSHDLFKYAEKGSIRRRVYEELIEGKPEALFHTVSEGVKHVEKGNLNIIFDSSFTFYDKPDLIALKNFDDKHETTIAIGLTKDSEFKDFLNYHLLKIREAGLHHWLEIKYGISNNELSTRESKEHLDAEPLGYENLTFAVLIVTAGVIISVAIALLEVIKSKTNVSLVLK